MSENDMPYPLLEENDARFELRPSSITGAGLGVFARVELTLGAELVVLGALVHRESIADRCTHFADHHKFRVGDYLLIPMGYGGLVNHSMSPNLDRIEDAGRVILRVNRVIAAGEELFFRYSDTALERFGIASTFIS